MNSPCFDQGKHPEFRKIPHFRESTRKSVIFWFGLPGRVPRELQGLQSSEKSRLSRKLGGGWKDMVRGKFVVTAFLQGPEINGNFFLYKVFEPKLTAFCRDSKENRQLGGQKSKSSRGNFRGEPPPLASNTF